MKHFIHNKKNNTSFDIVHLSGPKSNYTITENGGTLSYSGKDSKNLYDITEVEKFYWSRGETLKSTWAIEYGAYAISVTKLDIFGDNSCLVSYSFDPIFDIEISQVNMLDSDTKLLLSGSLSDQTGKTITNVGGVTLSSDQIKNNSKSLLFNGSNYLTVPVSTDYHFSTGDFTVEAWVNLNVLPTGNIWPGSWNTHMVLFTIGTPSSGDGFGCLIGSTNLSIQTNEAQYSSTIAHNLKINTWYHIAYVRTNGKLSFYINGKLLGSQVNCNVSLGTGSGVYIGTETGQGAFFNGYIDDLRVTKGVAKYTSDFIPKGILNNVIKSVDNGIITNTQDSYTSLLLSGSLIEKTGKTLTKTGKLNTSSVETKNNNKSIYFDGSSYFTVPTSSDLTFGTGDFTIEMWFNIIAFTDVHACLFGTASDGNVPGAIHIGLGADGMSLGVGVGYGSGSSGLLSTNTKHSMNTWNHMALTRSGSTLRMFLNGKNIGEITNSTNIVANIPVVGVMYGTRYFKGYIDDLRVSKGIARYTSNFTPKGLYHGVATNMITTTGKFGDALSFNGVNSFINTGYKTPTTQGKLTVSYWVYLPTVTTSPGIIYGTSEYTNIYNAISATQIEVASLQATLYYFPKTKLVQGWNHIVVHHTTTPILYINNQLVTPNSTNNSIGVNLSKDLWFGRIINVYGSATIDQVRIFDRPLTQTEITKLYNEQ